MYNNGAILSCKITKLATQSHRASSHSANYANEPRFSQTCQYSGLWKVLSQLKIGIQGPHLFLLCHKPIIVPLSSGNLKVKHDQRRRQLCSRTKKSKRGNRGMMGMMGWREAGIGNWRILRTAHFTGLICYFWKVHREQRWERIWLRVGLCVCGSACPSIRPLAYFKAKSSFWSTGASYCQPVYICVYWGIVLQKQPYHKSLPASPHTSALVSVRRLCCSAGMPQYEKSRGHQRCLPVSFWVSHQSSSLSYFISHIRRKPSLSALLFSLFTWFKWASMKFEWNVIHLQIGSRTSKSF